MGLLMGFEPADGRTRKVQLACLAVMLLVFAWVMWWAFGPSTWVSASTLPPSTPADELPLAKAKVFLQKLTWGRSSPWVLGLALLLLAVVAVREARREEFNDDAPRLFAVLVAAQAVITAAAWLGMHALLSPQARLRAGAPSLYYVVVGVLALASAVYLFFGRRAARFWYGLSLAVAVAWSFVEYGPGHRQFWMQVGMPALIAWYLFSWRVSDRLLPPPE